ncbi:hypothetical protein HKX68_07740 [Dickeya dadantii]|nr:hypothetical protein [Dickeya dadantii]
MEWLTLLAEPFAFPFMVKAMLAAGVVGMVCAVLSCFMVLKGWSLMGDAVSHAVLPGVVLAWLAGIPLAIGGILSVSWGVALAHKLPVVALRLAFCLVLVGVAVVMLVAK